jgi:thioredoxin 1
MVFGSNRGSIGGLVLYDREGVPVPGLPPAFCDFTRRAGIEWGAKIISLPSGDALILKIARPGKTAREASADCATLQRGEKEMAEKLKDQPGVTAAKGGHNGIVEVTDANFDQDVLKSDQPVLVDFWATWCGPCRAIAPIVEELAKDYQGKIKVGKMDVDSNSATPMRYRVTGIPTLLVFKGGQVVDQIVGYKPKDVIAQALNKHIG